MDKTTALASRLREVMLSGKWIANTNLKEQIENITWEQAVEKVGDLNNIALLVFHLNYYLAGLLQVMKGGPLTISDKHSFEMKAITNESEWHHLQNEFLRNAEQFIDMVGQMDEEHLHKPFVDEKYGTWQRNIEGVIEHSYYHLGQVLLLRKLIKVH